MELTEKYVLLITNTNNRISLSAVSELWNELANVEYQKSNVFLTALIDAPSAVYSPSVHCTESHPDCIRITCTRVPSTCSSQSLYLSSLRYIFTELKKHYRDTYIVMESYKVDLSLFPPS